MEEVKQESSRESSGVHQSEVAPPIKLVLNGGGLVMDSATIPVEWHFSQEVIDAKPWYIALYDLEIPLSQFEKEMWEKQADDRNLYHVTDLAKYLQLRRPGRHTLIAVVFCGDKKKALDAGWKFCSDYSLYYSSLSEGKLTDSSFKEQPVYIAAFEFEVPKELFATTSESWLGKVVWAWVNRWYVKDPRDECMYRKRKILAFTLQPFLFLIGRLFTGVFVTLYTLVGGLVLSLIGIRPNLRNLIHAWWDIGENEWNLIEFDSYTSHPWRKWGKRYLKGDFGPYEWRYLPKWLVPIFVPFELAAVAAVVSGLYGAGYWIYHHFSMAIILVVAVLLIIAIVMVADKMGKSESRKQMIAARLKEQERLETELKKEKEKRYLEFLKNNASLANVPARVDIGAIKKKVNRVTRFHISFWALKADVCKPYSK
jgi:hypothetical protein